MTWSKPVDFTLDTDNSLRKPWPYIPIYSLSKLHKTEIKDPALLNSPFTTNKAAHIMLVKEFPEIVVSPPSLETLVLDGASSEKPPPLSLTLQSPLLRYVYLYLTSYEINLYFSQNLAILGVQCSKVNFRATGTIDTLYVTAKRVGASMDDRSLGSVRRLSLRADKVQESIRFKKVRKVMNSQDKKTLK